MFPQGSPHLSHMGAPPQPLMSPPPAHTQMTQMGVHPSSVMQQMPGPPQAQVSGVIAQPTPYVSRSRIYAFVVDETGQRQTAIDMVNRVILENQTPKDSLAQAAKAEQTILDKAAQK